MRTVMRGDVHVSYSQIYVEGMDVEAEFPECMGGQRNGLCGAALPGLLFMCTGLHTGSVAFAVEVHDTAPPADESWEEIVEVSYRPVGDDMLITWAGDKSWPLDLAETDYRVRYCATGMDAGRAKDVRMPDEPEIDRYLLQFWPAPPAPDEVVKQTSEIAAYWHGVARKQPSPTTPEEVAEADSAT